MDRKRKHNDAIIPDKKSKMIDWNEMISASSIRNYMLDDPLLDWLKYYNIEELDSIPQKKNHNMCHTQNIVRNCDDTHNFIMGQGILFENIVYDNLIEKSKKDNHTIVKITESNNSQSIEMFEKTVEHMKKGTDIIYQGVLHDYDNHLYGCPDLLIRSDKFNNIFNHNITTAKRLNTKNNKLGTPFYYLVVDIKHSTIHLNCNMEYIRNVNCTAAYKGQILIYNRLLKSVQGYEPPCGYILGKRSMYTKYGVTYTNTDFMTNICTIDYKSHDFYFNQKLNKAIDWIKRMRTHGHTWKLLPKPSVKELYPNMKNDYDNEYKKIKQELADTIKEITNVWWCGYEKRSIAHMKKVYNWNNKKLSSSLMDFNNNHIAITLDHILDINRQDKIDIRLTELKNINKDWLGKKNVMEFYIDFETINKNIGQVCVDDSDNDIIFMIGLGWEEGNTWQFQSFIIDNNNDMSERKIMDDMWKLINNKMKQLKKKDYVFIHWTKAEVTFYNKFLNKSLNKNYKYIFKSFDLYKLFLDNNIVVRGALNFSLKTIGNAMYRNNLIETCWDNNSSCSNGLTAMFLAYMEYKKTNVNDSIMNDIAYYNMIDCKIMWDILRYLRKNYI